MPINMSLNNLLVNLRDDSAQLRPHDVYANEPSSAVPDFYQPEMEIINQFSLTRRNSADTQSLLSKLSVIKGPMSPNCYGQQVKHPQFFNRSDMAGLEDIFEDQLDTRKIIKCINNIDLVGLKSFLLNTNLDITKMTDENGFTLIILAAYVNSEKVMKLLIEHFKEKMNQFSVFSSDGSADKLPQQD